MYTYPHTNVIQHRTEDPAALLCRNSIIFSFSRKKYYFCDVIFPFNFFSRYLVLIYLWYKIIYGLPVPFKPFYFIFLGYISYYRNIHPQGTLIGTRVHLQSRQVYSWMSNGEHYAKLSTSVRTILCTAFLLHDWLMNVQVYICVPYIKVPVKDITLLLLI